MPLPLDLILITNAVFILIILIGAFVMIRLSVNYSRALGDNVIQTNYKWRIIRLVLFLFFTSLLAAIFNFLLT